MAWILKQTEHNNIKNIIREKGGLTKVRWEFTKQKITDCLGKEKIKTEDLSQLNKIFADSYAWLLDQVQSNSAGLTLEEIRIKCELIKLKDLVNQIFPKGYSEETWNKFYHRKEGISEPAFKSICDFLGVNYQDVGESYVIPKKVIEWDKLRDALLLFNHSQQRQFYINALQKTNSKIFKVGLSSPIEDTDIKIKKISGYWLIQSLLADQPENEIEKVEFNLSLDIYQKYFPDVASAIYQYFSLIRTRDQTPENLATKFADMLNQEQKDVILIFTATDQNYTKHFDEIITFFEDIFRNLPQTMVRNKSKVKNNKKLVVFLLNLSDQIIVHPTPQFLPIDHRFKKEDLENWINFQNDNQIDNQIIYNHCYNNIECIWKASQGKPELLLKEIFEKCPIKDMEWDDFKKIWIELLGSQKYKSRN